MTTLNSIKAGALAVALSLSAATGVTFAQSHDWHGGDKAGRGGHWAGRGGHGAFFEDLNLTDAQKTQIQAIHQSHREATQGLREQLRAKRQELHQLTTGATFDEALVRQKLTESAAIEARLMGEEFKMRQETQAIFTPEQKAKLEQKREQFKSNRQERRTHRGQRSAEGSTR